MSQSFSGVVLSAAAPLDADDAKAVHALGDTLFTNDGRCFRYALAGGSALVSGNLLQGAAEDTGDQALVVATANNIGEFSVDVGSATVTIQQYSFGWLCTTGAAGTGGGYMYKIREHPAASGATVTVKLFDRIEVAMDTSTTVDFVKNPYDEVIQNPTTATSTAVGVAWKPLTLSQYGWIQCGGIAGVLVNGSVGVGAACAASDDTAAGSVEAVGSTTQAIVGNALTGIADTDVGAVKLHLV